MLKASPVPDVEKWAIHDFEGFEGVQLSENEGLASVAEMAAFISEHDALGGKGTLQVPRTLDAEPHVLLIGISKCGSGEQAYIEDFCAGCPFNAQIRNN